MTHPRLSLVLDTVPLPPEGRIVVFGADAGSDLGDLPRDRLDVICGFAPDHAALTARGYSVSFYPQDGYSAALVFLSRSKQQIRNCLAAAATCVTPGGMVYVDGGKHDGVDSVLKSLRDAVALSAPLSKAHGKIAYFAAAPQLLVDWVVPRLTPAPGFLTVPGVFSAEKIDEGSALLAQALPDKLPARIVDLGAGWGWLSAQILAKQGVESLELIEADRAALDCAQANITDPRARFTWADATQYTPTERVSAVIMNPPFHVGRAGDPSLGAAFIAQAAKMLTLSGKLWMVANRHLPYEDSLAVHFHHVEEIGGNGRFKLLRAEKPMTASASARAIAQNSGTAAQGAARRGKASRARR
ncbi:MFS transporter [Thioclava sp. SK-1]|uniref:class I SAM-dependent methyltransferase n=1 Tax=Thioclava sp. SK-1 TaxID=1889770 RepID=UPI00082669F4|nr:class I SAM-dependent methyltransferase [Thioclava sp. SK-1]OCX66659.1 MFS transporter [Thioclava sp. SK-1]